MINQMLTSSCPSARFMKLEASAMHHANKSSYSARNTRASNGNIATVMPTREHTGATVAPNIIQTAIAASTKAVQIVSSFVQPFCPYGMVKHAIKNDAMVYMKSSASKLPLLILLPNATTSRANQSHHADRGGD